MRGPRSTERVLPTVVPAPVPDHHRCRDCLVDLCADLRVLGLSSQVLHQMHDQRGDDVPWPFASTRCVSCERDYRARY